MFSYQILLVCFIGVCCLPVAFAVDPPELDPADCKDNVSDCDQRIGSDAKAYCLTSTTVQSPNCATNPLSLTLCCYTCAVKLGAVDDVKKPTKYDATAAGTATGGKWQWPTTNCAYPGWTLKFTTDMCNAKLAAVTKPVMCTSGPDKLWLKALCGSICGTK